MEEESKMGSARMELELDVADAQRVEEEGFHHLRIVYCSKLLKTGQDLHLVVPKARVGTVGVAVWRELKITDQAEICRSIRCLCVIF